MAVLFTSGRADNYRVVLDRAEPASPRIILCAMMRHFDASVGTEELGHMEMISAIVYQLTRNLCIEDIKKSGFDAYFVDHTTGIYPVSASGIPFSVLPIASKGDLITDLHEDLAAEQKARTTYDNILRMADDPDVRDAIKFLREREVIHYQRFGEALRITTDKLDCKNFYAFNPEFDTKQARSNALMRKGHR